MRDIALPRMRAGSMLLHAGRLPATMARMRYRRGQVRPIPR